MPIDDTTALGGCKSLRAPKGAPTSKKITIQPPGMMRDAALGYARKGIKVFPCHHVELDGSCSCGKVNCKYTGKHPDIPFGYLAASADPDKVKRWWSAKPFANIGIPCDANNLAVLDVDPRNGGLEGLAELVAAHGTITSAVEAVSGGAGQHIVFAFDGDAPVSLPGHAAEGVDIKWRGYILAEPSNHLSGGTYRWAEGKALGDVLPIPLPAWVLRLKPAERRMKAGSGDDKALDARREAALVELAKGGPTPEELEEADAMRAAVAETSVVFTTLWETGDAKKLKDKTGSGRRASLASRMLDHHGGERYTARHHRALSVQWDFNVGNSDPDDRQYAREWAFAYKPSKPKGDGEGPGVADIEDPEPDRFAETRAALACEHQFGTPATIQAAHDLLVVAALAVGKTDLAKRLGAMPADDKAMAGAAEKVIEAKPLKTGKLKFETRRDIRLRSREPVRYLVDGLIEAETLFALTGDYETGKSLMVLDMAHCIAYGLPWAGRKTTRAGVLYLCPEGPGGLARRQDAWHLRQAALGNEVEDGPIEVVRSAVDLFNSDEHLKEIAERVRTFKDRHGVECEMVIVDTFRQSTPGADENSAKDVSTFTAKLNRMRDARKVACGYVHHQGKNAARGASGSTALIANVDIHLVAKMKSKGAKEGELSVGKLRDGENRSPISYRIVGHDAGMNTAEKMERAGVVIMSEPADFRAADMEVEASKVAPAATPASPTGAKPFSAAEDAPDPRLAVLWSLLEELGAGGAKIRRADIETDFKARLKRRKLDPMGEKLLLDTLADFKEEGRLDRTGGGRSTAYSLRTPTAE
ncbi:MAG: AAA family ATPase [Janthinobacterium lividum]